MQTTDSPLAEIRSPVEADLEAVDQLIAAELTSDVPLIQSILQHIVKSGGKRLRPLIVLLMAKALDYQQSTEHHELAAIIEFIHTATLLHDDVVDESTLRRGQATANAIWGNQTSVLVGDFLYSRAFQILARRDNIPVMKVLANTTNEISEGEVLQLMNRHNAAISEADYRHIIRRKTAQLFSAAAEIGTLISTNNEKIHNAMAHAGLHLGMAYQMVDDLLDYTSSTEEMGKNLGDDLAEGKATLPLIYAMHQSNASQATIIRNAIENGGLNNLEAMLQAIDATQAGDYTLNCAKQHIQRAQSALTQLPNSRYRDALMNLGSFIIDRRF